MKIENNTKILPAIADKIKTGREFMGSRWMNCESEVIACQTICACNNNLKNHGDAFSWLGANALRGYSPANAGTNNARGLGRLINDGMIEVESYTGDLEPDDTKPIAKDDDGNFRVIRVTDKLIDYAKTVLNVKE